jgi:DNA-binding response OmpR family regulator
MKKHILIIDDDQDILEITRDLLLYMGYTVTTLNEVSDIIAAMNTYNPDLVMVDYLLQEINGGELCAQIKRNEQTRHIPVILMSAHSRVVLSLGTYNCDELLEKPYDIHYLSARINHYLKSEKSRPRHKKYIKVTH